MDEYIDLETLKERFRKRIKWLEKDVHDQYSFGLFHGCEYDANLINELPAADVAPVRHGRWIEYTKVIIPDPYNKWEQAWKCSECGFDDGFVAYNYCPNCGAKMDGGAD